MKMIITRGVPASGKTTWAKEWLADDPDNRARVNRDDIRHSQFGRGWGVDENAVTEIQNVSIRSHFKASRDIVIDNTNLRARDVRSLMKIAAEFDAEVEFKDFIVDLPTALERDSLRIPYVGEPAILSFFKRFVKPDGTLPPIPMLDMDMPEDPERFGKYVPDPSLPSAIGFDLDGTLAHMSGRRGPYDTSLYHMDTVDEAVRIVLNDMERRGHVILVLSARSEDFREVCEKWLHDNEIRFDKLIMRKSGDTRRDDIVKNELFDEFIAPHYNFVMQFDDRDRVVNAFRARGIKVAQVAPGNF
ncbi:MAG: AAA family ATPase [Cetobacterium sp.]